MNPEKCTNWIRTFEYLFKTKAVSLTYQVRQLLHVIERTRNNDNDETTTSESEIDDTLLFRSITELQSVNQRLMSQLREAETKRDEMILASRDAEYEDYYN